MTAELGNVVVVINQIAIILFVGIICKILNKKTGIPYILLLMLSGTALASILLVDGQQLGIIPDTIRMLAIVIIVFANGFYLKVENILKQGAVIIGLSTIGVIITAGIIASVVHLTIGLALLPALFLGSLLCDIDPSAIDNFVWKYPKKVMDILNAEAIMNSPLTIILPLMIYDFAVYTPPINIALPLYLAKLVLLAGVGFLVGIIGFFVGQKALKVAGPDLEELTGLAVALIVFVFAENLGGSGIVAVGITSIFLNSSRTPKKEFFMEFNKDIATLFTIFVFVLLGAEFPIKMLSIIEITHIDFITVISFIIIARIVTVFVVSYKSDLSLWDRLIIGMSSPKGVGPAALAPLALIMAEKSHFMDYAGAYTIIKITYITIILSIILSVATAQIYSTIQKRYKAIQDLKLPKEPEE